MTTETNPLVAPVQDTRHWFTGIGAIEGLDGLISGIENGSWIEAGLGAGGTVLEAASAYWDPIGTLLRWAASWVMEYLEPSRRMLDKLGGNPPVIEAYAQTWTNISGALSSNADQLESAVKTDIAGWHGDAADTYRGQAAEKVTAMREAAKLCASGGKQVSMVGTLVGVVRTMVREAISALVAWLVKSIGLTVLTGPFGASEAVRTAVTEIGRVTAMISNTVAKLLRSLANLKGMLPKLVEAFDTVVAKLAPKGARAMEHTPVRPSAAVETVSPPRVHEPTPATPHETPNGQGTHAASEEGAVGGQKSEGNHGTDARGGDPVDAVSGQMITSATDVDLPGLLPLTLRRAYASGYLGGRLHGPGWSSTLDQRLEVGADAVGYFGDDAQVLLYREPNGRTLPVAGARWPLTFDADADTYRVEDPATGLVRHFAKLAERTSGTVGPNPAGYATRPITALTDRNGNRVDFVYDDDGHPTEVVHPGYRVAVTTVTTPGGPRIGALRLLPTHAADVTLAEYRYDDRGRLTEVVDATGRPYRYEVDGSDRVNGWVDRSGYRYRYFYDPAGRVVRGEGDGGYLTADFDYDLVNRTTTVTDSLGGRTVYHYDENQHLARTVDPLGNTELTEYDEYHHLVAHTDPLGNTTRYTRDADGNPTRIDRPDGTAVHATYNDLGQPVEITGPDGGLWRYVYDERGNLTAEVDPAGAVTSYSHGRHGEPRLIVDALGQATTITTNAAGLATSVTDSRGRATRYALDERGRVVAVTDPLGAVTATEWGAVDRPVRRTFPDGTSQTWRYDVNGDLVEQTTRGGFVTRYELGPFHQVAARVDPDGSRHAFGHDTELRLTEVLNPQGLRWQYTYDPGGNLVGEQDFNGRTVAYTHDAAGRLARLITGAGQTVEVTHDALGRIIAQHGDGLRTAFRYDPAGRLVGAVNPDADIQLSRDPMGRVLTESVNGRTLTATYDPLGRRLSRTTPAGHTSTWEYDQAGLPTRLTSAALPITFEYNAANQETRRWLGPRVAVVSSWDGAGRLAGRQLVGADGTGAGRVWHSRSWTYRADGVPESVADSAAGTQWFDLDPLGRVTTVRAENWTEHYAYDLAGNITFAADTRAADSPVAGPREATGTLLRRAGRTHFDYDPQGRLVRKLRTTPSGTRHVWHYRYGMGDRLIEAVNPAGQLWQYRYDALGRRVAKQRLGDDGGLVEETRFTWDGEIMVEQEQLAAGVVTATTWDHEPATWSPVSQDRRTFYAEAPQHVIDRQFHVIVTDLVGAPTELITQDGRVDWRRHADLWGNQYRTAGSGTNCLLRFPGQYHDHETGLDYNVHRYYDPETGRYTTPDPLGLEPGPNHHAYVANPLAYLDPLGLITEDRFAHLDRPGWTNYVLKDADKKVYYSGMFGPNLTAAKTEARHAENHNRFNAANGDTMEVVPGRRTYGESRLMEQDLARQHGTFIGRDGDNYRGNRQQPMDSKKLAEYQEYTQRKTGGGTGGCG
ncbi:RHS repeat-associated core domain-containing protein [Actinophytocola sp.]|uniref:RHS repeat-associated core domain-containing protein n=1 Tax=Actinophytocola sp. TaxID=1872138 RepID=UPI002D281C75|nr:RHS repeat-associated core domain-containing protein [Actinophytocola sp.]HYQ69451.1 RHS repeat-associated core domain-containing protein [Actinophytocola sp.]